MNEETLTIILMIIATLPLLLVVSFYNKINIGDIYKKIIIYSIFLLDFIGVCIFIISKKIDSIKGNILQGNYEVFLILIPIIGLLIYIIFLMKKTSLGKINIKIFGNRFISGEKLTGEIEVKLNENIKNANLFIYLNGYQYTWTWDGRYYSQTLIQRYEKEILLKENFSYKPNCSENYNYSFIVPYNKEEGKKYLSFLEKQYEKLLVLFNFTYKKSGREYLKLWKIEIILEKDGIELSNQKVVNIVRHL